MVDEYLACKKIGEKKRFATCKNLEFFFKNLKKALNLKNFKFTDLSIQPLGQGVFGAEICL